MENSKVSIVKVAWLAGLIEGEGYIACRSTPTISISMTDEDIIRRIGKLWKRPYNINPKAGSKMQYRINICGTPAIEWMLTIYSLMSYRRRQKIREVIEEWKLLDSRFKRDKFKCGHPKVKENSYDFGKYIGCRACKLKQPDKLEITNA